MCIMMKKNFFFKSKDPYKTSHWMRPFFKKIFLGTTMIKLRDMNLEKEKANYPFTPKNQAKTTKTFPKLIN